MSQLQNSSTRKIALSNPTRTRASSPTLSGRPPSTRRTGKACPTRVGFKIFDFPLSLQFCNCLMCFFKVYISIFAKKVYIFALFLQIHYQKTMGWEILVVIILLGLAFDYTNGFHDAANVVSTVIATRVLAPATAIILAALLNFLGATQISGVAQTIASGLVEATQTSQITVLCALIGAIFWNLMTWYLGIPSSSSYALVGGLVGAAWVQVGWKVVLWQGVLYKVIIPMVLSPIAGFLLGLLLMKLLHRLLQMRFLKRHPDLFNHLQVASASLMALSHGFNDAQKSMGIITLGLFAAGVITVPHIPLWVIASCALMMGLGTASGGFRIIRTVGYGITHLKPVQGFAAETGASCVILTAGLLGMPVSSTHMIVGSVTGVGSAKGTKNVRWGIMKKLVLAWIITLPGAGIVAALAYYCSTLLGVAT